MRKLILLSSEMFPLLYFTLVNGFIEYHFIDIEIPLPIIKYCFSWNTANSIWICWKEQVLFGRKSSLFGLNFEHKRVSQLYFSFFITQRALGSLFIQFINRSVCSCHFRNRESNIRRLTRISCEFIFPDRNSFLNNNSWKCPTIHHRNHHQRRNLNLKKFPFICK